MSTSQNDMMQQTLRKTASFAFAKFRIKKKPKQKKLEEFVQLNIFIFKL